MAIDISENVVLDIETLNSSLDKCSGSPKMTKALSRKSSCRAERHSAEELEGDELSKKLAIKVVISQLQQLKQPVVPNKVIAIAPILANSTIVADCGDGRSKRFNRLTAINPKRILLLFASMSSIGTMILIYFTLAIYWRGGSYS
ncbi:hypothetical protein AXF42_Ash015872 [Apostasia shenzhenica]|uniref:Uncharacterized protein n=1 Tax=Apostasia shenzhenica TaxID=1088818 RepID=A0A2H9ZXU5_9ASPA|nr:hypothetical protein AXF42_Ash015872 [Apostasia shenzhenica]